MKEWLMKLIPAKYAELCLRRSARYPGLIGHWVVKYQLARTLLDEEAVAASLGISLQQLATLAMCKVPISPEDIEVIAKHCGVRPATLLVLLGDAGYTTP